MPVISSITFEHPAVEKKINFFADWFYFLIINIGRGEQFELENPLSIIDKVIFQLENNRDNKYKKKYAQSYLSSSDFKDSDQYLSKFQKYHKVKQLQTGDVTSSEFLEACRDLRDELDREMFKLSLGMVLNYLKCGHELDVHRKQIKSHTHLLVTEYLYRGRNKSDLKNIFQEILSKDINKFPFPKDVDSEEQKLHHLSNIDFDGQFTGMFNLLNKPPQEWTFYFKLYGIDADGDFCFKYREVTFYGKEHPNLEEARRHGPFFEDKNNYIIACVRLQMHSEEIAMREAIKSLRIELNYMNSTLQNDLVFDTSKKCLIIDKGNIKTSHMNLMAPKKINEELIERLKDTPFHFLDNIQNKAKMHLLEFEYILINASTQNSMPGLWQYLETLMSLKADDVCKKIATIILLNEKEQRQYVVVNSLITIIGQGSIEGKFLGIEYDELREMHKDLYENKISEKLRHSENELIKDIFRFFDHDLTNHDYKISFDYYLRILNEAYAQRNLFFHQGLLDPKSDIKLKDNVPNIVRRLRWLIFEEIRNHEEIEFKELIDKLYDKASALLV